MASNLTYLRRQLSICAVRSEADLLFCRLQQAGVGLVGGLVRWMDIRLLFFGEKSLKCLVCCRALCNYMPGSNIQNPGSSKQEEVTSRGVRKF